MNCSPYVFPGLKMNFLTVEQKRGITMLKSGDYQRWIMITVCAYYEVMPHELKGTRGAGIIPWARQLFCYLCRRYTRMSFKQIGIVLNRDHSTIVYSTQQAVSDLKTYPDLRKQCEAIEMQLNNNMYEGMMKKKSFVKKLIPSK